MSSSTQLKHLNTVRSQVIDQIKGAQQTQKEAANKEQTLKTKLAEVDADIKHLTEKVVVSEHAMLRYIERVMGINMQEIQDKIMPEKVAQQVRLLQSGCFPVGNNGSSFRVRVRDRVVVTVTTNDDDEH